MEVKVCGMREPENMTAVAALKPDYMGFIFYERSKRYCGGRAGIDGEYSSDGMDPVLVKGLPEGVEPVMVTVDLPEREILEIADRYGFRTVQLHGSESPSVCRSLREQGMRVIKAVGISTEESFANLEPYEGVVDLFVFDTSCPEKGGSGKKFDWSLLNAYTGSTDFLLSGGIGPEDAEAVAHVTHPHFRGVDLNSRFEAAPALKDVVKLKDFMEGIMHNEDVL